MTDAAPPSPPPAAMPVADGSAPTPASPTIDLDAVERDLDGVESALARLADGTYRVDEVTGEPLPDDLLDRDPIARRS